MKFLCFILTLASQLAMAQPNDSTKPTTLILIRHAERGNDGTNDPPLAEAGTRRAALLVETLKNTKITAVYSTDYKRTRNTIKPLADAKSLEIKLYEAMKEEELKRIVNENKGGTVLICGHSNTTPWSVNFLTG